MGSGPWGRGHFLAPGGAQGSPGFLMSGLLNGGSGLYALFVRPFCAVGDGVASRKVTVKVTVHVLLLLFTPVEGGAAV